VQLKRRREFLEAAAKGRRWQAPAFVLQSAPRSAAKGCDLRDLGLGFTASRRVGKAVARNRARRRLREAARAILPGPAKPGYNYVIVARPAVLTWPFQRLLDDLTSAFAGIHRRAKSGSPQRTRGRPAS
jgi:ribonuclease P protein component